MYAEHFTVLSLYYVDSYTPWKHKAQFCNLRDRDYEGQEEIQNPFKVLECWVWLSPAHGDILSHLDNLSDRRHSRQQWAFKDKIQPMTNPASGFKELKSLQGPKRKMSEGEDLPSKHVELFCISLEKPYSPFFFKYMFALAWHVICYPKMDRHELQRNSSNAKRTTTKAWLCWYSDWQLFPALLLETQSKGSNAVLESSCPV